MDNPTTIALLKDNISLTISMVVYNLICVLDNYVIFHLQFQLFLKIKNTNKILNIYVLFQKTSVHNFDTHLYWIGIFVMIESNFFSN